MQYPTQLNSPSLAVDGTHLAISNVAARTVHAVRAWLSEARASWARHRHAKAIHDALAGLDDRMLRDLGFHRDEIASVAAEFAGLTEATRQRTSQASVGG